MSKKLRGLLYRHFRQPHWEGCADVHWDCRIAQLEAELARRDRIIAILKEEVNEAQGDSLARASELAQAWKVIARLKETLPTLKISHNYCEDCWYSCPKAEGGCCNEAEGEHCNCGADEHNSKIDALMKELG